MARLRRLTLCTTLVVVTAWTHPGGAAADIISGVVKTALQQQATVRGETAGAVAAQGRTLRLPLGSTLALAEPAVRAAVVEESIARFGLVRSGASQARHGLLAIGRARPAEGPGLSYPVSATISLGVGYSYVTMEDLAFVVAGAGSLEPDYDSHNLLIRAHWQF